MNARLVEAATGSTRFDLHDVVDALATANTDLLPGDRSARGAFVLPSREALEVIPRSRILIESDAPYLTPTPYRGRPNASYLVPVTMRAMAEVRDADLGDLCAAVDRNTEAAFGGRW